MQQALRPIELEDIARYRIPSGPLYSPDGKSLAFTVTRADAEKNENHTDVWLARDGAARQVTWTLDASAVLWDDDDTLILRRSQKDDAPGTTQLYRLDIHGGEARPWLTLPFPMREMKKAGGGYAVTGEIDILDPDAYLDSAEKRKQKAESRKEEADYQVVDEVPYWFNGAGFTNGRRTALFAVREESGQARCRRLTTPRFNVDSFCTDGGRIFLTGGVQRGRLRLYNRVYAADMDGDGIRVIYAPLKYAFSGLFAMNGRLYGHASDMKAYGVNETAKLCRIEQDAVTVVHTPEVSLYSSVIGDTAEGGDGSRALDNEYLTLATIEAHNAVFAFSEDPDGAFVRRTLWEQDGMACSMDACAERVAIVYQDWAHVAEVYELDRATGAFTQLTDLNDDCLKGRYIAKPIPVNYTSGDDALRGWMLLPQGCDGNSPLKAVLDIHGGPRCAYGETFFHEMQLWVARGYAVFFTNIRGSDGRGDDFADLRGRYGIVDYQNLMDFTDAVLRAFPGIDAKRLCVTGGSYGGFMTNWIIGHTDRFCCAASQRSIANWISMGFISDIGGFFAPDQCGAKNLFGPENTRAMWECSPLKYADRVRTPTLFIHSDEDYRCPLAEGMQMMQALAQRGVKTRMCIFHGENHELSRSGKPRHRMRRLKEITDWFDQHTR